MFLRNFEIFKYSLGLRVLDFSFAFSIEDI